MYNLFCRRLPGLVQTRDHGATNMHKIELYFHVNLPTTQFSWAAQHTTVWLDIKHLLSGHTCTFTKYLIPAYLCMLIVINKHKQPTQHTAHMAHH